MKVGFRVTLLAGAAVLAATAITLPAAATPLPGLVNLNFLNYTGASPKNYFNNVQPVGWTGGSGLIFIDSPGNSSNPASACGATYLQTYTCPSTLGIKGGYNYVEADGNPYYESGFNYTVSGLTVGKTYTLSFYQAASQQTGFVGNNTNQWIVSLGTAGLSTTYLGGQMYSYGNTDGGATVVATPLMTIPSGSGVDWSYVTVNLTADAATQVLSFLAWGNNGSSINVPPIAFLAGVNSAPGLNTGVPEPGVLGLFGAGLAAFGGLRLRRRSQKKS
ncbi:MAG TPA: PEP-CTERM sorting domain-containing protein [Rhizomicrobium sp.]|nr:PEP-CTERM sorting domain-containing protein [Rhizomicrobium sp.]